MMGYVTVRVTGDELHALYMKRAHLYRERAAVMDKERESQPVPPRRRMIPPPPPPPMTGGRHLHAVDAALDTEVAQMADFGAHVAKRRMDDSKAQVESMVEYLEFMAEHLDRSAHYEVVDSVIRDLLGPMESIGDFAFSPIGTL
jgi:hypothetical protein